MRIHFTRYYGSNTVTKSTMQVYMGKSSEPSLVCEARETQFLDYSTTFPGWTSFCLPTGTLYGRIRSTEICPLTIAIGPSPRQYKTLIAWNDSNRINAQRINIGEANPDIAPERRRLTNQQAVFERLTALAKEAYMRGEEVKVEIKNEILCRIKKEST